MHHKLWIFESDDLTNAGDICKEEYRIQLDFDLLQLVSFYPLSHPPASSV